MQIVFSSISPPVCSFFKMLNNYSYTSFDNRGQSMFSSSPHNTAVSLYRQDPFMQMAKQLQHQASLEQKHAEGNRKRKALIAFRREGRDYGSSLVQASSALPSMVSSVFTSPTNFPRTVSNFGQPFPGGFSNGVKTDFGQIGRGDFPGFNPNGVTTLYDGAKHYGSGATDTNGSIKHAFLRHPDTPFHHQGDKLLIFANVQPMRGAPNCHDQKSVNILNHLLHYDPIEREKFKGHDCYAPQGVATIWKMLGFQVGNQDAQVLHLNFPSQAIVIAKRVRTFNFWAMFDPSKGRRSRGPVHELDTLFILLVRFKDPDWVDPSQQQDLLADDGDDNDNSKRRRLLNGQRSRRMNYTTPYYWQFMPYVSEDKVLPPSHLWSNMEDENIEDRWTGACYNIGVVREVYGAAMEATDRQKNLAKQAWSPASNDDSYITQIGSAGMDVVIDFRC